MKASDIQKQRIAEIESYADELVGKCAVMFVSSINEKGYPRTCCVNKLKDKGFRDIYFVTSKTRLFTAIFRFAAKSRFFNDEKLETFSSLKN